MRKLRKKNWAKLFVFDAPKIRKKILPVLRKLREKNLRKPAQNSLRFMRKKTQKFAKKKFRENCANFAEQIQSFRGNPTMVCL